MRVTAIQEGKITVHGTLLKFFGSSRGKSKIPAVHGTLPKFLAVHGTNQNILAVHGTSDSSRNYPTFDPLQFTGQPSAQNFWQFTESGSEKVQHFHVTG